MARKARLRKSNPTVISYTDARNTLAQRMQQVCQDRAPLVITRQDSDACVLISLAEFQAIEETAYLLKSPANARRIAEALEQVRNRKTRKAQDAA